MIAAGAAYIIDTTAHTVLTDSADHAGVFARGMVIIVLVNLATNAAAGIAGGWWAWWSAWAFVGWGLGIAVHGLVVRLNRPASSSSSWEQRQIDKVPAR